MPNQNLNTDRESMTAADKEFENNIRPAVIEEFSGQAQIIENLRIFIKAAKMRGEALDHGLDYFFYPGNNFFEFRSGNSHCILIYAIITDTTICQALICKIPGNCIAAAFFGTYIIQHCKQPLFESLFSFQ